MSPEWLAALATRFSSTFPSEVPIRTVGREAEFPIVRPDGTAGEVADLWNVLIEPGDMKVKKEGDLIVQCDGPRFQYALEVGRGTLEVICEPSDDLHGIARCHEDAVERMLLACESAGFQALGYGIQPVQAPTTAYMSPKVRYSALHDIIGDLWLWFTLTASDQIHVAIARDEIVPMANLTNLLSAVTVALTGNSPVFEGADSGWCSVREGRMGEIGAGEGRHGMPLGPVASLDAYMGQIASHPVLMRWRDNERVADGGTLAQLLTDSGGPLTEAGWKQFLLHDHYIWNSGRPRHAQATIELRAACQQPGNEHMAGAALHLGLVEAASTLAPWLEAELGAEAWPAMRRYHAAAVRDGLAAEEPFPGFLAGVLDRCGEALDGRGRGEARYLDSLTRRLAAKTNPAQAARQVFADGGIAALVAHTTLS